jgi:hypothetical protein
MPVTVIQAAAIVLRSCERGFDWQAAGLGGAAAAAVAVVLMGVALVFNHRRSW